MKIKSTWTEEKIVIQEALTLKNDPSGQASSSEFDLSYSNLQTSNRSHSQATLFLGIKSRTASSFFSVIYILPLSCISPCMVFFYSAHSIWYNNLVDEQVQTRNLKHLLHLREKVGMGFLFCFNRGWLSLPLTWMMELLLIPVWLSNILVPFLTVYIGLENVEHIPLYVWISNAT